MMKRTLLFILLVVASSNLLFAQITVDGNKSDWAEIPILSEPGVFPYSKVHVTPTHVYYMLEVEDEDGERINTEKSNFFVSYIDADYDNNTGQNHWIYQSSGLDYMLTNTFHYWGLDNENNMNMIWKWYPIDTAATATFAEARFEIAKLITIPDQPEEAKIPLAEIFGLSIRYDNGEKDPIYHPENNWDFVERKVFTVKPRSTVSLSIAGEASLHSSNAYYMPFMKDDNINDYLDFQSGGYATQNPQHWASWAINLEEPGIYNLNLTHKRTGAGNLQLSLINMATNEVVYTSVQTVTWNDYQDEFVTQPLSSLDLSSVPAGSYMLKFQNNESWDLINLKVKELTLTHELTKVVKEDKSLSELDVCASCHLVISPGVTLTVDETRTYASVNVAPTAAITFAEGETINATINLQSDERGTATLITDDDETAMNATVQQYLGETRRSWYTSLPLAGSISGVDSDKIYAFDEPSDTWAKTSTFLPGLGVMITPEVDTEKFIFDGVLNNGTYELTELSRTGRGFHYLGNPYPSFLQWDELLANSSEIGDVIWFRSHDGNSFSFGTFNGEKSVGNADNNIAPMQGFWVRVNQNATNATVKFENALRHHTPNSGNTLLRSPKIQLPTLRLNISNGIAGDETVIYFKESNSNEIDQKDAAKLMNNNSYPEIWSEISTEKLAINAMQTVPYNQEIKLGFSTSAAGEFTLSASQFVGFDENITLNLFDKHENKVHNLNYSDYNFTANSGRTSDRFSIVFVPVVATGIASTALEQVHLFANETHIHIQLGTKIDAAQLKLYTISGQLLMDKSIHAATTSISHQLNRGAYFVVVQNGNDSVTKKLIIK